MVRHNSGILPQISRISLLEICLDKIRAEQSMAIAASVTQFALDDATYASISEELNLGEKSLDFGIKTSNLAVDQLDQQDSDKFAKGESIRAEGVILRDLHQLLKQKDPSFGGLVRVQNKRREFLWVHEQFVSEY